MVESHLKKSIALRFPPKLLSELEEVAKEMETSRSDVIRRACRKGLAQLKKENKECCGANNKH